MRLFLALALLFASALQAQAAVTFNTKGTLAYRDTYGNAATVAALQNALGETTPVDFDVTMVFDENPGGVWAAQSIEIQIGDRHWHRTSADWIQGYATLAGGVFMTALFDEYDPVLGGVQRIGWSLYFQGVGNSQYGPSNNPADYLNASRTYANFSVGVPDDGSIFLRLNPAAVTGPNNPVSSVSIDGAFVPRPPPAPAPEPSAWAMMLFGFGIAGAGLRSRRTTWKAGRLSTPA